RHEGRFYRITMAPFPGASGVGDVPIYLAAVNERMAEQAGRVADGISGHPMNSPAYLSKVVVPAIGRGAEGAGRELGEINITTNVITQISEDRDEARMLAAGQLAFYAPTRSYTPVLALHGFEDRVGPIREAHARGAFGAVPHGRDNRGDPAPAGGGVRAHRERVRLGVAGAAPRAGVRRPDLEHPRMHRGERRVHGQRAGDRP